MVRRSGVVPTADRRLRTARIWMLLAAAALLINGVTVTTLLARDSEASSPGGVVGVYDDDRAAPAIDIARVQVLGVVSLDASSGNAELVALSDRTTATFRTDFDEFVTDFLDEVREENLQVTARVVAAGLADLVGDRATVIVATSGLAVDSENDGPRNRHFQMQVELVWIDDAWRVNDLEFV